MTTPAEILEELLVIVTYANIDADFTVESAGDLTSLVKVESFGQPVGEFLVSSSWAMGNLKRLPDRTTLGQIRFALEVSHPDVKDVGPKHPERR